MRKNSYISNFRFIPKAFLIFIILVISFESCIYFIPEYRFSSAPYGQIAMKMKAEKVDKKNRYDCIVIGDCLGWAGIKPVTMEKKTSLSAYNFCIDVFQTYMVTYILLSRYLRNCDNKPKLVILQISADSLLGRYSMDFNTLRKRVLSYIRVDSDLIKELSQDVRFKYYKFRILTVLPSVRRQYLLRKKKWFLKILRSNKAEYKKYAENYVNEKGFFNEDMDPRKQKVEKIEDIESRHNQLSLCKYNLVYIEKILSMLRRYNIRVVVCTAPVRKDTLDVWSIYGVRNKLNNSLKFLLENHNNAIAFWDMSDVASDKKYFADSIHLTNEGADIYSSELSKRINELDNL